MNILVGVILALAIGVGATWVGFDRDRAFYPTVTIVVGSYYILFAAMSGSTHTVLIESLVFVPFLIAAVLGFARTPWIVALALAAHGCLDLVHGRLIHNPGVPDWWPGFCLAYDGVAAGYLGVMLLRRRAAA